MFLLLSLNIFLTLFYCSYSWLGAGKCLLRWWPYNGPSSSCSQSTFRESKDEWRSLRESPWGFRLAYHNRNNPQQAFICLKSAIETPEQLWTKLHDSTDLPLDSTWFRLLCIEIHFLVTFEFKISNSFSLWIRTCRRWSIIKLLIKNRVNYQIKTCYKSTMKTLR